MMFYATAMKMQHAKPDYDQGLVWASLLLLGLGAVMVYSASIAIAGSNRYTGYQESYYLFRHLMFVGVSLLFAFIAFQFPVSAWNHSPHARHQGSTPSPTVRCRQ